MYQVRKICTIVLLCKSIKYLSLNIKKIIYIYGLFSHSLYGDCKSKFLVVRANALPLDLIYVPVNLLHS